MPKRPKPSETSSAEPCSAGEPNASRREDRSPALRAALATLLERFADRLRGALEWEGDSPWRSSLAALVRQAPRGIWTVEARLLYDLQKVCVDYERQLYTIDLVEWALSWGKRPIKRPLPHQRDVLMSKHLRSAARRLAVARLSDRHRQHLSALIRAGIDRAEQRIRHHLGPPITGALDTVGLVPRNVPERVARHKIVEEMLDKIVEARLPDPRRLPRHLVAQQSQAPRRCPRR